MAEYWLWRDATVAFAALASLFKLLAASPVAVEATLSKLLMRLDAAAIWVETAAWADETAPSTAPLMVETAPLTPVPTSLVRELKASLAMLAMLVAEEMTFPATVGEEC